MVKTAVQLIVSLCFAVSAIAAQPAKQAAKPIRPTWSELSPAQKQVLAPIEVEWEELDTVRRKKWVEMAKRFPKMSRSEQQLLQKRMKDWVQNHRYSFLGSNSILHR